MSCHDETGCECGAFCGVDIDACMEGLLVPEIKTNGLPYLPFLCEVCGQPPFRETCPSPSNATCPCF